MNFHEKFRFRLNIIKYKIKRKPIRIITSYCRKNFNQIRHISKTNVRFTLFTSLSTYIENWGFSYVLAYWQTEISSSNLAQQFRFWDGGINVQRKQPFLPISLFLLLKFLQSSMYVLNKWLQQSETVDLHFSKWFCCHHSEMGLKREIIGL